MEQHSREPSSGCRLPSDGSIRSKWPSGTGCAGSSKRWWKRNWTRRSRRSRYQRPGMTDEAGRTVGYRHGRRECQLLGSFGPVTISVPRARLSKADGTSREWHSSALPRYARMTKQVEAVIAGAYLSGTNTRRIRRALGALFKGAVSKDTVSRTWRKVQTRLGRMVPPLAG